MTVEELKSLLENFPIRTIHFGWRTLTVATPDTFDAFQVNCRVDDNGESLINMKKGGWKEDWYVIAKDDLEDPLFMDLTNDMIYTSGIDEDGWEHFAVAPDMVCFEQILAGLQTVSAGRDTGTLISSNPVVGEERKLFLSMLSPWQKKVETWYWEDWLEG